MSLQTEDVCRRTQTRCLQRDVWSPHAGCALRLAGLLSLPACALGSPLLSFLPHRCVLLPASLGRPALTAQTKLVPLWAKGTGMDPGSATYWPSDLGLLHLSLGLSLLICLMGIIVAPTSGLLPSLDDLMYVVCVE